MFEREKNYDDYSGPDKETILSDDTRFKGSLEFSNKLIINGKFEGNLQSKGTLMIGASGEVKAEIKVGSVIIDGKVWGNITADDKIELKASAELYGDIKARRLVISEGATFIGQSDVSPNRQETPAAQPAKTSSAAPASAPQDTAKKVEKDASAASAPKDKTAEQKDKDKQQLLRSF
ncbi:MAG: polymer-forming cytoskeletal protein [Candidatus Auribacter fodinae]|jgi:cytoskeletal protein CcmA (bactofilin family)|uniref:Polymer-forming cytoskeletal protein n=1 Tax=Candidatus Auribacter fodinae TaxID=2093366 RepID=A0A3A4R1T8_9BACT|nr:MAG: polymer-forming cytoskeletal protein [Candidatus Auribacter fodinae]